MPLTASRDKLALNHRLLSTNNNKNHSSRLLTTAQHYKGVDNHVAYLLEPSSTDAAAADKLRRYSQLNTSLRVRPNINSPSSLPVPQQPNYCNNLPAVNKMRLYANPPVPAVKSGPKNASKIPRCSLKASLRASVPSYQLKATEANRGKFPPETTPYAIKECNMDVPEDFIENGNDLCDGSSSTKRNSIESSNSSSSGVYSNGTSVNLETNRSDSEAMGFSNENWLLKDRCLSLGSSGVSSGILALTMSDRDMSENSGSSLAERVLTSGRLKLRSNAMLSLESRQFVTNLLPQRKSIFEVFDQCCCECKATVDTNHKFESGTVRERPKVSNYQLELAQCSSSVPNRCRSKSADLEETKCKREHLCIQTDPVCDHFVMGESAANYSNSPSTSDSSCGSKKLRSSCPDLVKSCGDEAKVKVNGESLQLQQASPLQANVKLQKHQRSRERQIPWSEKPVHRWQLDDILQWLQSLGLDDVATILIGYDLCGTDVEAWTSSALDDLGVPKAAQETIFDELSRLKLTSQMSRMKKSPANRYTLFSFLKSSEMEQIQAVELPLDFDRKDFSVAEGLAGGLVVTKAKEYLGLERSDCIIELNGECCLRMPAVDFNKRLAAAKARHRLVVLRQRHQGLQRSFCSSEHSLMEPLSPIPESPTHTGSAKFLIPQSKTFSGLLNGDDFNVIHF